MCKYYLSNFARFRQYCLHMYPHQMAFDVFTYTGFLSSLHIICFYLFLTIMTNILLLRYNTLENYYYCRIFCNTTINTPYVEILLLLHNMLRYYYHHTMCSNPTIIIAHCDKTTNIDVSAKFGRFCAVALSKPSRSCGTCAFM